MTLAQRLDAVLARDDGDVLLLAGDGVIDGNDDTPAADAAVLIAVTDRAEPGVLLTRRPDTMRRHPGQVAFPGGRIDPGDADAVAAALREAWEEIALPPAAVEVVGVVDHYHTLTGFRVTPVLAVVPPDLPLAANPAEVAELFEVPLGFLLDPANHIRRSAVIGGQTRHYFEMVWQGHRIWGATAAMLVNLSRRLRWPV